MPFPLHKAPSGLLDLFRLRTLGANPPQFGDTVTPVTDVSEFYGAANKLASGGSTVTGGIGGAGITSTLTLTARVRIHSATAIFTCGAAAATNVTVGIRVFGNTGARADFSSEFFAAINAGGIVGVRITWPNPLVLPPGWAFQAAVNGTAAGVDHAIISTTIIDVITPLAP